MAWSIVGGGLLSVVLTIAWAITTSDVTLRWATLSLAALMLLGFSALSLEGRGLFTAPVGIVLLAFCLFKLILGRTKSA